MKTTILFILMMASIAFGGTFQQEVFSLADSIVKQEGVCKNDALIRANVIIKSAYRIEIGTKEWSDYDRAVSSVRERKRNRNGNGNGNGCGERKGRKGERKGCDPERQDAPGSGRRRVDGRNLQPSGRLGAKRPASNR
jgi:hypothetical protein